MSYVTRWNCKIVTSGTSKTYFPKKFCVMSLISIFLHSVPAPLMPSANSKHWGGLPNILFMSLSFNTLFRLISPWLRLKSGWSFSVYKGPDFSTPGPSISSFKPLNALMIVSSSWNNLMKQQVPTNVLAFSTFFFLEPKVHYILCLSGYLAQWF